MIDDTYIKVWHTVEFKAPQFAVKVKFDHRLSMTENLDRAFTLTNINVQDMDEPWHKNEEVEVCPGWDDDEVRSTSVGDIMVVDKRVYSVDGCGFISLNGESFPVELSPPKLNQRHAD